MRWPWSRRRGRSPFDQDVLRPGDPGWDIMEHVMKTGKPVIGVYDTETGSPGEHRITGGRAWCYDCSTWCYDGSGCPCCEPGVDAEALREALREEL